MFSDFFGNPMLFYQSKANLNDLWCSLGLEGEEGGQGLAL